MSAESIKYFESKTTEQIVDWMMENLNEEQMKACLNDSGVPEISPQPEPEIQPVPTVPVMPTLPGGSSSSEGAGGSSGSTQPRGSDKLRLMALQKYRKKCESFPLVIDDFVNGNLIYYEFGMVTEEDLVLNPNLSEGDVNWILRQTKPINFKDNCTPEELATVQEYKETFPDEYNNPPAQVYEIVEKYIREGYTPPINRYNMPPSMPSAPSVPAAAEITNEMAKVLKTQRNKGRELAMGYPNLFSKGLTMPPVFIHSANGTNINALFVVVRDSRLELIEDTFASKLTSLKLKSTINTINSNVENGLYSPTNNILDEIQAAFDRYPNTEIKNKIKSFYDRDLIDGLSFYGGLEEVEVITPSGVPVFNIDDNDVPVQEKSVSKSYGAKKVTEMTIPEIEERMKSKFGAAYVAKYKPEHYVNKDGVKNVRYVKREPGDSNYGTDTLDYPKFTEFGSEEPMNSGDFNDFNSLYSF